jgi:PncC family amidohydrolase
LSAAKPIEEVIGNLLRAQGLTLSTAESCTGGLISHRLTNVSGSSDYFLGGVVAYANEIKERVLKVSHDTLVNYGAVSEPTARAMAQGARQVFGSHLAVAVTGIAGPSGGSASKPVGLVYIALAAPDLEACHRFVFNDDRVGNKSASAQAALELVEKYLRQRIEE